MVWCGFSFQGVGPVHRIDGIMNSIQYCNIMAGVMLPYSVNLRIN